MFYIFYDNKISTNGLINDDAAADGEDDDDPDDNNDHHQHDHCHNHQRYLNKHEGTLSAKK